MFGVWCIVFVLLFFIFLMLNVRIGCLLLSLHFDDVKSVNQPHYDTYLFPNSFLHTHTHTLTHPHTHPAPPPSTRSVSHTMHFKQKGISGLSWKELPPGQTTLYVFDDPLKPRKLLLHCGHSILNPKRWEMHDYSFLKCQLGWIIWCLSSLKSWYQCTYWPVHLIYDLLVPI